MPKGIYAAASAMVVKSRNQEAVAHNPANLQTAGYRNETALRTSFAQLMTARGAHGGLDGADGAGVLNAGSYYTFTQGCSRPPARRSISPSPATASIACAPTRNTPC